jgi:hypothetical protein
VEVHIQSERQIWQFEVRAKCIGITTPTSLSNAGIKCGMPITTLDLDVELDFPGLHYFSYMSLSSATLSTVSLIKLEMLILFAFSLIAI